MSGNSDPIFSKVGNIGRGVLLTTAAADYTGFSLYNREVFAGDATNGSFIQRIRFKARGTNVATVARVYINNGNINTNWTTAPAAPTGVASGTGTALLAGTYFAVIIAIGPKNSQSVIGAFSIGVAATLGQQIAWSWTAVPGAVSYRIYISTVTGFSNRYFTSATNSFTQVLVPEEGSFDDFNTGCQVLFGEVSLPATTASATVATPDVEYLMNVALPPGYEVYVGLGTTVAAGWSVFGIGGNY